MGLGLSERLVCTFCMMHSLALAGGRFECIAGGT